MVPRERLQGRHAERNVRAGRRAALELAQHLGRSLYPADKNTVIETLRRNNAPDRLVAMAERLPAHERFGNVQSIAEAVGIATEHRRA